MRTHLRCPTTLLLAGLGALVFNAAHAQTCSVWLVESGRIVGVPYGEFMPDRAFISGSSDPMHSIETVDLPINVGVIKCGTDLILYDTGPAQRPVQGSPHVKNWAPLAQQLQLLRFDAAEVTKIVLGNAHWDHAGQLAAFPNAMLYVQKEEVKGIEWALNYPEPHIRAVGSDPGGCFRTPACGYSRQTLSEIEARAAQGKAVLVDGEQEISPGVVLHPAFRANSPGSQLLEVPTSAGKLVFGSGAYSSWQAIRDWMIANPQQTDTVQQFLAYEQCYKITGGYQNCVAAHEPLSYSDKYPLTKNWWIGINGSRMAEIALAPGEKSRRP